MRHLKRSTHATHAAIESEVHVSFSSELCMRVNATLIHGDTCDHPFIAALVAQVSQERQRSRKAREARLNPLDTDETLLLWRAWSEGAKLPRILKVQGEKSVAVEPNGEVRALVATAAPSIDVTLCPKCSRGDALKFYDSRFMCFRCNLSGTAADWIALTQGVTRAEAVALVASVAPLAQLHIDSIGSRVKRVSSAPRVPSVARESTAACAEVIQWVQSVRKIPLQQLPQSVAIVDQSYPDVTPRLKGALASGAAVGSLMRDCNGKVQNVQVRFIRDTQIQSHGKRLLMRAGTNSVSSVGGDPYTFGDTVTRDTRCVVVCEGDMDTLAAQVTLPRGDSVSIVGAYAEGALQHIATRLRLVNCIPESVCILQHHDARTPPKQVGLFAAQSRNVGHESGMKLKAALAAEVQPIRWETEKPATIGVICTVESVSQEFLRAKIPLSRVKQVALYCDDRDTSATIEAWARTCRVDVTTRDRDDLFTASDEVVLLCNHRDPMETWARNWYKKPMHSIGYAHRVWNRYGASGVPCRLTEWQVLLRSIATQYPETPADSIATSVSWDYNDLLTRIGPHAAVVAARHLRVDTWRQSDAE